jgi:hypothetical protein
MVKDFDGIMRKLTAVFIRTLLFLPYVLANYASIRSDFPSPVPGSVVVIGTSLLVVVALAILRAL